MDTVLLTPEEAATLLRVSEADVLNLVRCGDIAALNVAGKWRITSESVIEYIAAGLRKQNAKALGRALSDRARWAEALRDMPDVLAIIEGGEFQPGSMGAFLQEALAVRDATTEGKVTRIHPPGRNEHDT